jgi:hypothetical protein
MRRCLFVDFFDASRGLQRAVHSYGFNRTGEVVL